MVCLEILFQKRLVLVLKILILHLNSGFVNLDLVSSMENFLHLLLFVFLPIFLVRRPQKRGDFVAFFFVKSGVACSVHTTIVRRRKSKASSPTVCEDVDLFPMGKKKKEARRWRKLPQSTSLRNNVFIRARLARSHCSRARNCLALTTATVLYTSHAAPAENNQRFELNSGVAKESFDFKILFYLSRSGLPKNI